MDECSQKKVCVRVCVFSTKFPFLWMKWWRMCECKARNILPGMVANIVSQSSLGVDAWCEHTHHIRNHNDTPIICAIIAKLPMKNNHAFLCMEWRIYVGWQKQETHQQQVCIYHDYNNSTILSTFKPKGGKTCSVGAYTFLFAKQNAYPAKDYSLALSPWVIPRRIPMASPLIRNIAMQWWPLKNKSYSYYPVNTCILYPFMWSTTTTTTTTTLPEWRPCRATIVKKLDKYWEEILLARRQRNQSFNTSQWHLRIRISHRKGKRKTEDGASTQIMYCIHKQEMSDSPANRVNFWSLTNSLWL